MDEMVDVTIGSALLSELLLALRDRQLRTQDDLEAFRIEFDLFKTLKGPQGDAWPWLETSWQICTYAYTTSKSIHLTPGPRTPCA